VRVADLPEHCTPATGGFIEQLRPSDLPTVMRKAFDLARPAFGDLG